MDDGPNEVTTAKGLTVQLCNEIAKDRTVQADRVSQKRDGQRPKEGTTASTRTAQAQAMNGSHMQNGPR